MRGPITPSTVFALMQSVPGSRSAKIGRAPAFTTASAVAKNVKAGTITSSPGSMSSARSTIVSASVPFATPTQ